MSTVPGNHFGCYPSWAGPSVGPGTVGSKPVDLKFPVLGLFGLYDPGGACWPNRNGPFKF